ncbi:MAG: response regulator transcription factor [Nitrospira sp.]|nr:response regulator transcription factor [Nitrospira sp.]
MALLRDNRRRSQVSSIRTTQRSRLGEASECLRTAESARARERSSSRWSERGRLSYAGRDHGAHVTPRTILVIEDDPDIANLVHLHLCDSGYQVDVARDGTVGLQQALAKSYDLVILDLMLPGIDGLELCRKLRGSTRYSLILMLTSKSTELDRVLGLEVGADDYLTKPFSILELLARVKALFRRMEALRSQAPQKTLPTIRAGDLVIEVDKRKVQLRGQSIELTAKEFDLLLQFAQHPGQVYTRATLLDAVWGYSHEGYEHTVNSHINRLRAKIEDDSSRPRYILTVWGVGYSFTEEWSER